MYTDKIVSVANKLNANIEGYTLNLHGDEPKTSRHNQRYIVGGFAEELKIKWSPANVRGQAIYDFVEKNIAMGSLDGFFFGVWTFDGHIYLDVCVALNNKTHSLRVAKEKKEIAIFDNLYKETIMVSKN